MKTLPLLIKHPFLFIFGCLIMPLIALILLVPVALLISLIGFSPRVLGVGIAGLIIAGFIPFGIAFTRFVVEKPYRSWKMFNKNNS